MNKIYQKISSEWLLFDISFQLFTTFEKKSVNNSTHQVSFVPVESVKNLEPVSQLFANGILLNDFKRVENPEHIMIIKLQGKFYSIDKILFDNMSAGNERLQINLKYIRVESLDGDPFEVDAFILIPVNRSLEMLSIDFLAFKKEFSTGRVEKATHIEIPRFEIDLKGNMP